MPNSHTVAQPPAPEAQLQQFNTIPAEDTNSIPSQNNDRLTGTANPDDLKNAYKGFRDSLLYRQPNRYDMLLLLYINFIIHVIGTMTRLGMDPVADHRNTAVLVLEELRS